MKFKDYDDLNLYDRIAVKTIVAYLSELNAEERDVLIVDMRNNKTSFVNTMRLAIARFKENYNKELKNNMYLRHIGLEYIRYMDTIGTDIYLNSVPDMIFDCIADCFE